MKLVIDRQTWLRGEGSNRSRLLRQDGKMCCLGFYALACGLEKQDIVSVSSPYKVEDGRKKATIAEKAAWLLEDGYWNSKSTLSLIDINDSTSLSATEREENISKIFAQHGVEVEFIN